MNSKTELRQQLLTKRRAVDVAARHAAAAEAAALFSATKFFHHSQHIACYYPLEDEFDCLPIIEKVWAADKQCYLPFVTSKTEKVLDFVNYHSGDKLQPNRYKILEPTQVRKIALDDLDVVLLPLVGFDQQGNRLGMGGGYYDRTFEMIRQQQHKKCYLIGLAYEVQEVAELPCDPWDVGLDVVITEKRVVVFP